ncbi:uncharacterized protein N7459_005783 [Penicillium hispanicum]|uniref:uncharacterized protein n=1 Tax=Penicillium hispanicum TaxID=1080232 RepID=UPI002541A7A5|nr:uncharacterized protein N7459_005783 [Penicillium hispanicum]KAJ5579798.1 hypothetical protein N7459_005783 [Penicillium hispanicum]
MGVPNPSLDSLEQRRLTLEDNILQLQKSLYHWRTWEAEYDGFRDEIRELHNDASTEDLLRVGREFGGTLVNEEEMQTILGKQGVTRSREQVIGLLGRRIDYVKQNVATMEKRLHSAEDDLSALDTKDQVSTERGADFPMREILEELDDDGNVVSRSVNTPGDQAPQLLEVLKHAGVEDIPEKIRASQSTSKTPSAASQTNNGAPVTSQFPDQATAITRSTPAPEMNRLSQDEEMDLTRPVSLVTAEDRKEPPVTAVDESPEEARLRREMLQYGIDEVGAIVAELELDEDGSEFSVDDEDYDFETEEEEEDEFGRSHTVLSDEYHQQMRELEAKLNARGMWNMGKDTQTFPEEVQQEIEQPAPANDAQPDSAAGDSTKGKKPKKRVAFANDLDIAPTSEPPKPQPPVAEKRSLPPQPDVPVLTDAIVERTDRTQEPQPATAGVPKKVSRFKSARSAPPTAEADKNTSTSSKHSKFAEARLARKQANTVPSAIPPTLFPATPHEPKPFSTPIADIATDPSTPRPPQGKTLADQLVERDIAPGAARAPEPDELDEEMHRREIASEFYNIRNRMIQNNGGFVNNDAEMVPIETEEQPRVSKFKAARMR